MIELSSEYLKKEPLLYHLRYFLLTWFSKTVYYPI